jgi:hypothetical protein
MSQDEARGAFEKTFEILANPAYNDSQKLYACIAFLQYAPLEFFADYPRECKAVVSGAFQYGATWADVADAASIKVDEAQSRWLDVETPRAATALGYQAYQAGDYEGARRAWLRVIAKRDPEFAPAVVLRLVTILCTEWQDVDGAKNVLREVISWSDATTASELGKTLKILEHMHM